MTDEPARPQGAERTAFDELLGSASSGAPASPAFTTVFRGYDKDEVDEAVGALALRLRAATRDAAVAKAASQKAARAAEARAKEATSKVEAQLTAVRAELAASQAAEADARSRIRSEVAAVEARMAETEEQLRAALAAAEAKASDAQSKVEALSAELSGSEGESAGKQKFEEILRVAEDQAGVLIRNATVQGDRLLEAAREEVQNRRSEVKAEGEAIASRAQHDAQQVRLRIETELTAHTAQIEREAQHAAEKVAQAEQEAAAIRTEAEKGAAALRSAVARETAHARAEAEEAVTGLRMRALEFEESLTRRQDDAQQEFLMLHNQAVAHAERITQDANEQVAASLEHAQRVAGKADAFEKLMRAQAAQIEADANVRAREVLERAHLKAGKIIDTVTSHSQAVLRDAEDRTRQLRWQQHQLTSFMAEVKELIRPESPRHDDAAAADDGGEEPATSAEGAPGSESAVEDASPASDDEAAA